MGRSRLYHVCSFNLIQCISNLLPASFQLQFTASYDRILDAIKAMIHTAASVHGIEKDLHMQRASFLQGTVGAQPRPLSAKRDFSLSPCNCQCVIIYVDFVKLINQRTRWRWRRWWRRRNSSSLRGLACSVWLCDYVIIQVINCCHQTAKYTTSCFRCRNRTPAWW